MCFMRHTRRVSCPHSLSAMHALNGLEHRLACTLLLASSRFQEILTHLRASGSRYQYAGDLGCLLWNFIPIFMRSLERNNCLALRASFRFALTLSTPQEFLTGCPRKSLRQEKSTHNSKKISTTGRAWQRANTKRENNVFRDTPCGRKEIGWPSTVDQFQLWPLKRMPSPALISTLYSTPWWSSG